MSFIEGTSAMNMADMPATEEPITEAPKMEKMNPVAKPGIDIQPGGLVTFTSEESDMLSADSALSVSMQMSDDEIIDMYTGFMAIHTESTITDCGGNVEGCIDGLVNVIICGDTVIKAGNITNNDSEVMFVIAFCYADNTHDVVVLSPDCIFSV